MEFKDKLRKLREEQGLSQADLAKKIYASRSAVAKWENGLGLPGEASLTALVDFFGVERASLIGDPETETVFVYKNQKMVKQKNVIIALLSVLLAAVLAAAVFLVILAIYPRDYDPMTTTVIDGVLYERVDDGKDIYYRVRGLRNAGDTTYGKDRIVLEDEVDGRPVKEIDERAFQGKQIREFVCNERLERIGRMAFADTELGSITFNEGLTELGDSVFENCSIAEVTLPDSLMVLPENTFYRCDNLERVTLGSNLRTVETHAFALTPRLETVIVPSGASIGPYAFWFSGVMELVLDHPDVQFSDLALSCVPMLERVSYVGGLDRWNRIANALKLGTDQLYLMTDGVQYYLIQYSEDRYGENGMWEYVVDEWGYMIGYPG